MLPSEDGATVTTTVLPGEMFVTRDGVASVLEPPLLELLEPPPTLGTVVPSVRYTEKKPSPPPARG